MRGDWCERAGRGTYDDKYEAGAHWECTDEGYPEIDARETRPGDPEQGRCEYERAYDAHR